MSLVLESAIAERDQAQLELRQIRAALGADPEESTLDEVARVVEMLKKARYELVTKALEHYAGRNFEPVEIRRWNNGRYGWFVVDPNGCPLYSDVHRAPGRI